MAARTRVRGCRRARTRARERERQAGFHGAQPQEQGREDQEDLVEDQEVMVGEAAAVLQLRREG